ncbi:MAG: adenosylcobinamide-GDP ribazoletransferase [Pseudomonadota bacterium]
MNHLQKLFIAIQFLTRLPTPTKFQRCWSMEDLRESVHMFPLVGVLVGLAACLVYVAAVSLNLPLVVATILAVATQILMTGALHEDGLADVCDGFGGGHTIEQKLAIMRDSRLGTYGAIGLILGLGLRLAAIVHLAEHGDVWFVVAGLIAAATLSRAAMPLAMLFMPQARPEGLAASAGRPRQSKSFVSAALGGIAVFLCLPPVEATIVIVVSIVSAALFLDLSRRQIGGITGDVLGGLQQVLDILVLVIAAALVRPG